MAGRARRASSAGHTAECFSKDAGCALAPSLHMGPDSGCGQGQKWWAGEDQAPTELMQLGGQLSGPGWHNLSSSPGVALGSTGGFRQETQTRSQKHMSFWRQSHQVLWSWPGRGAYLWGEVRRGGRECWRGQGSEHQGLHEDLMHLRVLHQHHLHHLCVGGGAWRAGHSSAGRAPTAPEMGRCLWVCRSRAAPPATGLLMCS